MTRIFQRLSVLLAAAALAAGAASAAELQRTGGPYVPTPLIVVEQMLALANVGKDDYVIDLGSGDGIIVLTAVQRMKARGYGVDIDPELVKFSNDVAKRLGITDRAKFEVKDIFQTDLSRASVLTLYLLPSMMASLQSKVFNELKPGARVVSHDYHFGDWKEDDVITLDVPEKEKVNGVPRATIYLWIVPAKVAGRWRLSVEGAANEKYELDLKQRFQMLEGSAASGGRAARLQAARLRGESVHFAFPAGAGRHVFTGQVSGDTMKGTVELGTGKGTARWTATRIAAAR
jgi:SAM-dependent methyltransferase